MTPETPAQADEPEIPVRLVQLWLCDLCLDGKGGECHSPGCSLWLNRAPDLSLRDTPMVTVLDVEQQSQPLTAETPAQAMAAPEDKTPPEYQLLGWAATLIACSAPGAELPSEHWRDGARNWQDAYAALVATPAAQQPQPARELAALRSDEFARVKVRLCALIDRLDKAAGREYPTDVAQGGAYAQGAIAEQLREILNDTALGRTPQPAPELAKLRELLGEIGVMAANAPEDGDSFALLETIAMRIAAADVPDTTPIDEWPHGAEPGDDGERGTARRMDALDDAARLEAGL